MSHPRKPVLPRVLLALGLAAGVALVTLSASGRGYYVLSESARPLDPRHATLRPSGTIGLPLGILGTGFMVLNLAYLARKRLAGVRWLGPLRSWMALHVFTGLVGPGMIVVHSAFAPHGALGSIAFVAMGVVVATGLVGRYIYARVPRSLEGRELEADEIRRRLSRYVEALRALGVDASALLERARSLPAERRGVLATLGIVARGDPAARRDLEAIRAAVRRSPALQAHSRDILPLARRLVAERTWLARYHELRALMGSWRFFHRWLAIVMLLLVVFHVVVAVRYGDLGLFGRGP